MCSAATAIRPVITMNSEMENKPPTHLPIYPNNASVNLN